MKIIPSLLISLSLLSLACQPDRNSRSAPAIADSLPAVPIDSLATDMPIPAKPFVLAEPDMAQIEMQSRITGESDLYTYLLLNYDTLQPKKIKRIEGYHACRFTQPFSQGIVYTQDGCSSDAVIYGLTLPITKISAVKRLLSLLHHSQDMIWSKDSLQHLGKFNDEWVPFGEYIYFRRAGRLMVRIFYTD